MASTYSKQTLQEVAEVYLELGTQKAVAEKLNISQSTVHYRLHAAAREGLIDIATSQDSRARSNIATPEVTKAGEGVEVTGNKQNCTLTLRSRTIRTLEAALEAGHVDTDEWDVDRWILNKWDVVAKLSRNGEDELAATELWQVKVWFRRRKPVELSIISLLDRLTAESPIVPKIKRPKLKKGYPRRALEICIMDPHLGLNCFPPHSDTAWSLDDCENMFMWAVEGLIDAAKNYGPFEEILFPFGNDYLHADNLAHTTTAGTGQPEMVSWHHTFDRGEILAIAAVDRMKEEAPVIIKQIPGNHDRLSSYTLGRVLRAYYHGDANVEVDATSSQYKFWRFGCNLVGLEHGNAINPVRLAALMANECPEDWAATKGGYREWHLGDQHRKGSSKPVTFEEQGVSVEYLPALTPPNEWHRLKAFNWQKRGAMAWVWDYDLGPVARLQVNINTWTGLPSGIKKTNSWRDTVG